MKSMLKPVLSAGAAAIISFSAAAQDVPGIDAETEAAARQLVETALESDLAWDIVEDLTTDVGPRLAGSPAEARARDWGVEWLEELGFENVRIETFDMPYWTRGDLEIAMTAPYDMPLYGTALGGSGHSPDAGPVEAEIVYFRTWRDIVDAEEGSLDGRIAFIDGDPMVATLTGAGYGPSNQRRRIGWQHAQRAGAEALIVRSVGSSNHRNPHTGMMSSEDGMWADIPVIAVSNPDADHLRRLHERDEAITLSLASGAGWRGEVESGNVVGEIVGSEYPEEIIVIGGHLDSWDLGTGAIDDGAGVAITTAVAALIGDMDERPRRTIRVVMWGAEEVGLLGARAYAAEHADQIGNHVLASESDFGADRIWQLVSNVSDEANPVIDLAQEIIEPLGILRGGSDVPGGGPDVIPLAMAGVPTFRLSQDGTDYFNLHHTPDDTLDKIDPEKLAQNVAAWAAVIYLAAMAEVDYRDPPEEE